MSALGWAAGPQSIVQIPPSFIRNGLLIQPLEVDEDEKHLFRMETTARLVSFQVIDTDISGLLNRTKHKFLYRKSEGHPARDSYHIGL